ncbi:MAG: type II secretion system GspH family protein, partial [Puniceicoccales bacterium]|nr:type II secretion system GspH family protein [Puniceicoccales bacterium]
MNRTLDSTQGFSLIELLVIVTIIVLMASLLLSVIRKSLHSSQRAQAASRMEQIIVAYTTYIQNHSAALGNIDASAWENMTTRDWITWMAERGYINDPRLVMFDFDPLVKKYSAAGFLGDFLSFCPPFFGAIPRRIWDASNKRLDASFAQAPLSIHFSGIPISSMREPVAWTRGLNEGTGRWNPVQGTTGDGSDGGIWGTSGGLVAFANGRVQWFETFRWVKVVPKEKTPAVDWQGETSYYEEEPIDEPEPKPPESEDP